MSEGTMQRAAESDQHQQPREARAVRAVSPARAGRPRRGRVLVGAAVVPVMLLAVGCSSDSDSDSASGDGEPSKVAESALADTSTPEVVEAAYSVLPDACEVFSQKTLKSLVPEGVKSGKAINAAEENVSGDCRWISLDNNGVDGSQYRWLSVSLHLLESDATNGPGEDRAHKAFESKVTAAKGVDGATSVKTEPVAGVGDEATAVRYDLKKKDEGTFKQQTIVVRTENVVITLDYNGAGLAGEKTPDGAALLKSAKSGAEEAVEAVEEANESDGASSSPSSGASKTPSKDATKSSSSSGSGADVSSDSDSGSSTSGSSSSKTRKSSR
ncbi:hypothetical protein [Streptomyces ipomoeae]|uniref:Uncharacterized protein n=1 Tax=Streptomyces ipomoeae 91-03 TaxID=698759 RepID=L1L1Q2_9ACTN|nr:hypothetical protein [Streptomyces ipomoeae]EKX67006.1 hypothetical protein STRIP9103_05774 [Streptomyces ipomoeae 91-03]